VFDFRYHALSLVAVFIALTVGLVLGVAIGDRGLVSNAERDLRASLRRNVVSARADAADARKALAERRQIEANDFFPIMVGDRLSAERIGLVALGDVPNALVQDTKTALDGTGARFASVSVIGEPLDLAAIASASGKTRYAKLVAKPVLAGRLGRKVGEQLAVGGKFLGQIQGSLFQRSTSSGSLGGLEGVVLVHRTPTLEGRDGRVATLFEDGLVEGLRSHGVRIVGVEGSEQQPSAIPWFKDHRLASVDNLDLLEGRVALVLALAGEQGTFGVKSTADALLPSVVDRPPR
jgi:Copper transport outer membrane protein, MctB